MLRTDGRSTAGGRGRSILVVVVVVVIFESGEQAPHPWMSTRIWHGVKFGCQGGREVEAWRCSE